MSDENIKDFSANEMNGTIKRSIISMADISKELNKITKDFSIVNTVKMQRANIVAYLTFALMENPLIDRSELHLFTDILRNQYINGSREISDCYNIYLVD